MSYAMSAELQTAVFNALLGSVSLGALVEGIYDAPPDSGGTPPIGSYITLGDEVAKDRSSASHTGTTLDFEVIIHSDFAGFSAAKAVAAEVVDTLLSAPLGTTRGQVVLLTFLKSRTRRGAAPETRRIALVFRAILDDSIV